VEAIDLAVTARAVAVASVSAQAHGASSTVSSDSAAHVITLK